MSQSGLNGTSFYPHFTIEANYSMELKISRPFFEQNCILNLQLYSDHYTR